MTKTIKASRLASLTSHYLSDDIFRLEIDAAFQIPRLIIYSFQIVIQSKLVIKSIYCYYFVTTNIASYLPAHHCNCHHVIVSSPQPHSYLHHLHPQPTLHVHTVARQYKTRRE
jgi:hypothetical protein